MNPFVVVCIFCYICLYLISFRKTMEKLSLIDLEHLYGVTCYISGKMLASSELTSKIEGITSAVSKKDRPRLSFGKVLFKLEMTFY